MKGTSSLSFGALLPFTYTEVNFLPTDPQYVPQYKSEEAACCDLVARIPADPTGVKHVVLSHRSKIRIGTGLTVEIPIGYKLCIAIRSSWAEKGLIIPNAPAQIDSDYRDEIEVLVLNVGREIIEVKDGDRFAQCWLEPVHRIKFVEKEQLSETDRDKGGFGSTGVR